MIDEVAMEVFEALQACRCCLQREPAKNLMRPYIHQGKTEIYLTMLKECFNIHLDLNSKECGICEECVGRLRDASVFKLQVQRSQAELRAKLKRALEIIDNEPVVKSEIDDNETSINLLDDQFTVASDLADDNGTNNADDFTLNEDMAHESRVSNDDANKEEFISHEEPQPSDVSNKEDVISVASLVPAAAPGVWARALPARARAQLALPCAVRLARLRGERATRRRRSTDITFICREMHDDSNITEEAARLSDTRQKRTPKTSVTKRAQRDAEQRPDSKKRTLKATKRFTCDVCNKTFSQNGNLKKHLRVHTGKSYSCKICNKQYAQLISFKYHQLIHSGGKPAAGTNVFTCDVCNQTFSQKGNLKRHLRVHTGEKPYACTMCDEKFTFLTSLRRHQYQHTGVKPYSCEICNKQYVQMCDFKDHQQTHSGEKSYSCKLCPKKFSSRRILNVHTKRVHTKEKNHACGLCTKRFVQKYELTLHMTNHTGQQPFRCELCDKKFLYNTHLRQHILMHTGERPYTCDMCNARFRQKFHIMKHIIKKACSNIKPIKKNESAHKCEICEKSYTAKSTLKRHLKKHAKRDS